MSFSRNKKSDLITLYYQLKTSLAPPLESVLILGVGILLYHTNITTPTE
nr:MAG TPA: hypothetical protein [Caudoviricetes sp.]